jgi:hypothetical protein
VDLYLVHVPFGFVPDETSENPAKNADGSYILDDTDILAVWKVISHIILILHTSKPVKFARYVTSYATPFQIIKIRIC